MGPVHRHALIATSVDVLAAGPVATTPEERARADRLHRPEDRRDYLASRVLARALVAHHTGAEPDDVRFSQTCARCAGPHGRPVVVGLDVHVAWSHSAGLVAAIVDDDPCAVDLESLAALRTGALPLGALAAGERVWLDDQADRPRAFAELWVRKEVLVKLGDLTLDQTAGVDVTPSFSGRPVRGRYLVALDPGPHDAVAAWSTTGRV
ncbi:hypothetical protein [Nocardioides sp. W7]|uniref:4'-phosphopantetheinyl transferase family protein n=1 Tax=Nocardioides sp. W7 TaxID=2931390 RepID=UPI001FD473E3|nr:hypothetical protein [Nocardioides sp. W7]